MCSCVLSAASREMLWLSRTVLVLTEDVLWQQR